MNNKNDHTAENFTPLKNPYDLFQEWFQLAEELEPNDPSAMCLATVASDGRPSARMVLLKEADECGFKFHTNNMSRKGKELQNDSHAALCFHWKSLRKQIRVEGSVIAVSQEESDAYYRTRSRQSQIGAWASQQSRPLESYQDLIKSYADYEEKFKNEDTIPKPDYWVGFRLEPTLFEFWQDGEHRLHQRHVYELDKNGNWNIGMLYP